MSTIFSVISEINVVNRFFMELFYTSNIDTVKECQMFFSVSTLLNRRVEKFQKKYQNQQNVSNSK